MNTINNNYFYDIFGKEKFFKVIGIFNFVQKK